MENRTCELNNPGFEVEGHRSRSSTTERALVLQQHAPSKPAAGGGHGASSGVGNESDAKLQGEKAKHQSDENDANLKR